MSKFSTVLRLFLLPAAIMIAAAAESDAMPAGLELQSDLRKIAGELDGRVGICAWNIAEAAPVCVNGDERFSLQSVMKLVAAAAVLDAVDRGAMKLGDVIAVRPEDASPGPREFADLVRAKGVLETSVEELMRRAVADSDSTSIDILIGRLGGVAVIQDFLKRRGIENVRIDRDERTLQAQSVGLEWRSEYADSEKFEAAAEALPIEKRDSAWTRYLNDPRDTATPRGMAEFLKALASGRMLSAESTRQLLSVMESTTTGPDRLKAGTPPGWILAHKTGTGREWRGMTAVTNDSGILTAPGGGMIALAVFVAESKRSKEDQAAVIASAARLVTAAYRAK